MWTSQLLRHGGRLCIRSVTSSKVSRHYSAVMSAATAPSQRRSAGKPESVSGAIQTRGSHLSTILERGAYDVKPYQHVTGCETKSLDLESDGRMLKVTWGDGSTSKFHSVWLGSTCFCGACRMDHTGQPTVKYDQLTSHLGRIQSVRDDGEGCLEVQWTDDPGHIGLFPLRYLKENCYSKTSLDRKRGYRKMTFSKDNAIPRVTYDEVMNSRKGVYKWVKGLNETGISIVEGVPCEEGMVKKTCSKIAEIMQHTIYGETFDVKAVPRPINAAYSAGGLQLHMDQPMYESPPGIQALHCIKFDENIEGGDNMFVDLFHVAETFRESHPKEFALLSNTAVPYETIHYDRDWPVHMRYQRNMFGLNEHGDLTGVVWHPHLMGAVQLQEERVEPFFDAIGKFYALISNFPHYFRHRLFAGQMVAFNNRRVLHGRAAYSNQSGERFLQGTYVEISEFKSCVQVLSNLEGDGSPPVRVGDFDMN